MRESGNHTRFMRHSDIDHNESREESAEDILLAQMELFVIIIAVIAVVAALLLLLLLQIRIKKQSAAQHDSQNSCETSVEEVAAPDPNDPYTKTAPPAYTEVMKSPERYPLSSSYTGSLTETTIQIVPHSCPETRRSKRTWAQLVDAVIRSESLVPNEKRPPTYTTNCKHDNNYSKNPHETAKECEIYIDEKSIDDVLPSYEEVCFTGITVDKNNDKNVVKSRDCSAQLFDKLGQYGIHEPCPEKMVNSALTDPLENIEGVARPRTLTI